MPIKPTGKRKSWTVGVAQVTREKADTDCGELKGAPDNEKHLLQTMLQHSFI